MKEVRDVARSVHESLLEAYPSSFKQEELDVVSTNEIDQFNKRHASSIHYYEPLNLYAEEFVCVTSQQGAFTELLPVLEDRPKYAELPKMFSKAMTFRMNYRMDFGSFRDIQRHRNGYCPIPLIKDYGYGIHSWYIDSVREALTVLDEGGKLWEELSQAIDIQMTVINSLVDDASFGYDKYNHQYLYPLGIVIPVVADYDLSEMLYVSELRSGQLVHPTCRRVAKFMAGELERVRVKHYADMGEDKWSTRRGAQTIFADGKALSD